MGIQYNIYIHIVCHDAVPIITCPEIDLESQVSHVDQMIPGFHLNDSSSANNGFTLLGEGEAPTLSHQLKVSIKYMHSMIDCLDFNLY